MKLFPCAVLPLLAASADVPPPPITASADNSLLLIAGIAVCVLLVAFVSWRHLRADNGDGARDR